MYKTIRHGENSLQYTILPQNDDIRMDGKLTSASSSSSNSSISNTGNCHRIKRNGGSNIGGGVKNKSFYAYLGLLFVCTVIIGAILIPFLVSAECLPNPSDWFLKTKVAFSGHSSSSSSNNNNNNSSNINKTNQILKFNNNNHSTTSTTSATIRTTSIDKIKISNNNQSTDSTINKAYPNENNIGFNDDIPTTIITATTTTNSATKIQNDFNNNYNNFIINKQILNKNNNNKNDIYKIEMTSSNLIDNSNDNKIEQNNIKDSSISNEILISNQQQHSNENIKFDNVLHTTNTPFEIIITTAASDTLSSVTDNIMVTTDTTIIKNNLNSRKLLPPLPPIPVTKNPIILPVLAKTNSIIKENGIMIPSERNESKNWIKSHWPFIDPSTYFQWTGYKSEDSVLLPAILGITLIGIIVILTLCLAARNKRTIVASVRKRNRNDIDETGEDNATLLTTANLSDADDE